MMTSAFIGCIKHYIGNLHYRQQALH